MKQIEKKQRQEGIPYEDTMGKDTLHFACCSGNLLSGLCEIKP